MSFIKRTELYDKCVIKAQELAQYEVTHYSLETMYTPDRLYCIRLRRPHFHRFIADVRYHHVWVTIRMKYQRASFFVKGILRIGREPDLDIFEDITHPYAMILVESDEELIFKVFFMGNEELEPLYASEDFPRHVKYKEQLFF